MRRSLPMLLFALAAPAAATSGFPTVIRDTLALDAAPACLLCHTATAGGAGTATKPFAVSMRAAGLVPFNVTSLEAALTALEADGTDSDGDGTGDIDELVAGTDPNLPPAEGEGEGEGEGEPVQYGFGCADAPAAPLTAFALLTLARCSRRRRHTLAASSMSSSLAKA